MKSDKGKKKSSSGANRLEHLKEQLMLERDQLLNRRDNQDKLTEISGHGDLVDQSNDFNEREILLGMAEHEREKMVAINEALLKIEEGAYGVCAMCGEDIPEVRLMAAPTSIYCVQCQGKVETQKGVSPRFG